MKMQDWKMRHKPARVGKCETGKCGTEMQDVKMQDWKMRHKAAEGGKCRNGKSGKRKVWNAVCKIIIWHYAYRMHEVL